MGISGALTTAVTGMRAQAYALENVSGNIANSQTTAFKRIDTAFQDMIPDMNSNRQLAGSVVATLPMVVVFLIFQRRFIQGISMTGLKG